MGGVVRSVRDHSFFFPPFFFRKRRKRKHINVPIIANAYYIRISPGRSVAGDGIRTRVNNIFQLLNEDVTTTPAALRLGKMVKFVLFIIKRKKSSCDRSMTQARGPGFESGREP